MHDTSESIIKMTSEFNLGDVEDEFEQKYKML